MKYLLPKGSKIYNVFWGQGQSYFYRDSHLDTLDEDIGAVTEVDMFFNYTRDIKKGFEHPYNFDLIWVGAGTGKGAIAICVAKRDMMKIT